MKESIDLVKAIHDATLARTLLWKQRDGNLFYAQTTNLGWGIKSMSYEYQDPPLYRSMVLTLIVDNDEKISLISDSRAVAIERETDPLALELYTAMHQLFLAISSETRHPSVSAQKGLVTNILTKIRASSKVG